MNEKQTLSSVFFLEAFVAYAIPSDFVVMRVRYQLDSYIFGDLQTNATNRGTRRNYGFRRRDETLNGCRP